MNPASFVVITEAHVFHLNLQGRAAPAKLNG
jgi:hypothetical protein